MSWKKLVDNDCRQNSKFHLKGVLMNQIKPKGYAKRPWELSFLPWIFLVAPLVNLVGWWIMDSLSPKPMGFVELFLVNYGYFGRGFWDGIRGVTLLIPYVLGIVTAVGLWVVRPWGFWTCAFYGVVAWFASAWNYTLYTGAQEILPPTFSPLLPAALVNLVFFIPVLFLLQRDLVAPFFESHLKWWEQNKRVKLALPVEISFPQGIQKVTTYDLSLFGCFIPEAQGWELNKPFPAKLDLRDGKGPLSLSLQVNWSTMGSDNYPAGVGCRFVHFDKVTQGRLEIFLKKNMIKDNEVPHRG